MCAKTEENVEEFPLLSFIDILGKRGMEESLVMGVKSRKHIRLFKRNWRGKVSRVQ